MPHFRILGSIIENLERLVEGPLKLSVLSSKKLYTLLLLYKLQLPGSYLLEMILEQGMTIKKLY